MSGAMAICGIPSEVEDRLKKFRFAKAKESTALVLKIDKDTQQILVCTPLTFQNI